MSMDPTDLSGLDASSARDYVTQFMVTLRTTRAELTKLGEERAKWEGRIKLAVEGGRDDLMASARERLADVQRRVGVLAAEEQEQAAQLSILRDQLRRLQQRFDPTIDTEQLLAQLEAAVGERDELADQFKELQKTEESERALQELKERMRQPDDER